MTLYLAGGRYGLGSKDTPPSSVFAVYKELEKDAPKHRFTIGIVDDVTNLSAYQRLSRLLSLLLLVQRNASSGVLVEMVL